MWPERIDLVGIIDGRQHPGVLDHLGDLGREDRGPGIARLEALDGPGEVGRQPVGIDLEVAQDLVKVRVLEVQELQQEVLQVHLVVGVRHAQARCGLQRAPAGGVQFPIRVFRLDTAMRSPLDKNLW